MGIHKSIAYFDHICILLSIVYQCCSAEDLLFVDEALIAGIPCECPCRFIMQADCNLVLYVNQNRALWSSRTNGRGTACRTMLQNTRNLVILNGTHNVNIWSTGTAREPNNYRLTVQGDGNTVTYGAAIPATTTVHCTRSLTRA